MTLPQYIGVVGGGRMGAGIAHAFVVAGATVTVVETDTQAAAETRERLSKSIAAAESRGALDTSAQVVSSRLSVQVGAKGLDGCGLVVESVPEDLELKQHVLATVAKAAPEAILATNTSALSIDALAEGLDRPERFLGLHFFNPVPSSSLVEIVVGARTDPAVVAAAQGWVAATRRTAITVADAPGFASSRLGVVLALEAMRMVEEGVASVEDIDTAMMLGYKHPTGPLRTTDVVGLDVRLAIAENLAAEFGKRFEPPSILREKVAAGHIGRKSGQGFYTW